MAHQTPEGPGVGASGDTPRYRHDPLFALPRRMVVPRPVYRHRWRRSLRTRISGFARAWSVGRLMAALFSIFAFGLIGVFIADLLLCPESTGVRFWEGCLYETIGFGAGGGILGFEVFLFFLYFSKARTTSRPTPPSNNP